MSIVSKSSKVSRAIGKIIEQIRQNDPSLTKVSFNSLGIDVSDCAKIAAALSINTNLLEIDLGGNMIKDEGAIFLAEALKWNSSLEHINLVGNGIREDGAAHLAAAMEENASILSFD